MSDSNIQVKSPTSVASSGRAPALELADMVLKASSGRSTKAEAEVLRDLERRAEIYGSAFLDAKRPALNALPKEAGSAERLAQLRKQDVEVVSTEITRKWAEVDARDFRGLQGLSQQEDAAIVIAELVRTNATYRGALVEHSPDVAHRVHYLNALNNEKIAAKDDRKSLEAAMIGVNAKSSMTPYADGKTQVRKTRSAADAIQGRSDAVHATKGRSR